LPALLLVLTIATGVVDAVSILTLGRVFVANMTGNVVFIGFALAHAPGFSLSASLIALGGFLLGAGVSGLFVRRLSGDRARLLAVGSAVESVLLAAAACILVASSEPYGAPVRDVVVAAMALALGIQNAVVRQVAVPDFTTTVLTMTLTGIASDLRSARGKGPVVARRVSSVLAMLGGAVLGAELTLHHHSAAALFTACALVAVTTFTPRLSTSRTAAWRLPT
jgi:uncharacterized membrane protein YoaK (UPF0700 family)